MSKQETTFENITIKELMMEFVFGEDPADHAGMEDELLRRGIPIRSIYRNLHDLITKYIENDSLLELAADLNKIKDKTYVKPITPIMECPVCKNNIRT